MPNDPPKPQHEHTSLIFPKGFLWGAATSAYQVEGNNIHSDWWQWEQTTQPLAKRSGQACNHYKLYEQDFDLAQKLGHNAHRLSIEWSRIEPKPGEFDDNEIEHYRQVLKALKDRGMKVMLSLWHFTNPKWVAEQGGWENGRTVGYFIRFVQRMIPELKEWVDLWITVNEPEIYIYHLYIDPQWPGAHKSLSGQIKAFFNFISAHKQAYQKIHQVVKDAKVGVAKNVSSFEAYHKHSIVEQGAVIFSDFFSNHAFYLLTLGFHDFLGLNYYFHHRFRKERGFLPKAVDVTSQGREVSDLGWEIHPEGLFDILTDLSNGLPIYITECGIASTNDDRRTRFLLNYLQEVYRAIQAGVDIKGFFYWSLIDNFEWHRGFDPRFGLINIDYKTQKRIIRSSAHVYEEIIKHNGIPHHLLKLLGHRIKVEEVLEEFRKL